MASLDPHFSLLPNEFGACVCGCGWLQLEIHDGRVGVVCLVTAIALTVSFETSASVRNVQREKVIRIPLRFNNSAGMRTMDMDQIERLMWSVHFLIPSPK
jgi:hypothetical protein